MDYYKNLQQWYFYTKDLVWQIWIESVGYVLRPGADYKSSSQEKMSLVSQHCLQWTLNKPVKKYEIVKDIPHRFSSDLPY